LARRSAVGKKRDGALGHSQAPVRHAVPKVQAGHIQQQRDSRSVTRHRLFRQIDGAVHHQATFLGRQRQRGREIDSYVRLVRRGHDRRFEKQHRFFGEAAPPQGMRDELARGPELGIGVEQGLGGKYGFAVRPTFGERLGARERIFRRGAFSARAENRPSGRFLGSPCRSAGPDRGGSILRRHVGTSMIGRWARDYAPAPARKQPAFALSGARGRG
jgi:hypothetical protein